MRPTGRGTMAVTSGGMPTTPYHARATARLHVDWSRRHPLPAPAAMTTAALVAVTGALAADWLLVTLWTRVEPAARGYEHFRRSDYATLTVIGVLAACAAWPVVCRISPTPRWLFLRLAVVVTVVSWLPDVYLLVHGQPPRDVGVLMVLHLAAAVVTYQVVVRLAPPRAAGPRRTGDGGDDGAAVHRRALLLAVLVGAEFALGVATLVVVPTGRPTGWWPEEGTVVYLAHALVGLPLVILATLFLVGVRHSSGLHRVSGWVGAVGVGLAGAGGLLAVTHPFRLVGAGLMLVGPAAAGFGYLIPTFDRLSGEAPTGDGQPAPD